MKKPDAALIILRGFQIHYNYFRPHQALGGRTPAEAAGIDAKVKSWKELMDLPAFEADNPYLRTWPDCVTRRWAARNVTN